MDRRRQRPELRPGQEWVWDYPRPPRLEPERREVRVEFGGVVLARSVRALRCLETSHPPVYYLPPDDVAAAAHLVPSPRRTWCEFKGRARYWTARAGGRVARDAAWSYPEPAHGYEALKDHLAFYPGRVDACFVGGERVEAQAGDFYGGWVTAEVVGPFKGEPGTEFW